MNGIPAAFSVVDERVFSMYEFQLAWTITDQCADQRFPMDMITCTPMCLITGILLCLGV